MIVFLLPIPFGEVHGMNVGAWLSFVEWCKSWRWIETRLCGCICLLPQSFGQSVCCLQAPCMALVFLRRTHGVYLKTAAPHILWTESSFAPRVQAPIFLILVDCLPRNMFCVLSED